MRCFPFVSLLVVPCISKNSAFRKGALFVVI